MKEFTVGIEVNMVKRISVMAEDEWSAVKIADTIISATNLLAFTEEDVDSIKVSVAPNPPENTDSESCDEDFWGMD